MLKKKKKKKAIALQAVSLNTEVAINLIGSRIMKKPGHSPTGFTVIVSAS